MTRALLLAAGLGTRLGKLSLERPKPLFPVADIPLIRYAIALLRGHGITEIAINLHHQADLITRELGDGRSSGVNIVYSHEPEILGTGGGIFKLREFLTQEGHESFFVVNAKILIDVNLAEVRALHERHDAVATLVLKQAADAARWGAIEVDGAERVTRILDEGTPGEHRSMFTGVHLLTPRFVATLPGGTSDSIRHGYLPALKRGDRICGQLLPGYFHEHSTPERYLEGNWNVLDGRATLGYPPGQMHGVSASATVAAGAELRDPVRIGDGAVVESGARLGPLVVVGHGARVRPGVSLERTVVWPNIDVTSSLSDAIVTPETIFQLPKGDQHGRQT